MDCYGISLEQSFGDDHRDPQGAVIDRLERFYDQDVGTQTRFKASDRCQ